MAGAAREGGEVGGAGTVEKACAERRWMLFRPILLVHDNRSQLFLVGASM